MTDHAYRSYRTDDDAHPFVICGPDAYDDRWTVLLNAACEGVKGSGNQANVARWTISMLNHLHTTASGRDVIALNAKRKEVQPCLRGFLSARGYTLAWAGAKGGFLISRADGRLSDVDAGIRVLSRLFALVWPFFRKMKKDPLQVSRRQREYRRAQARRREEGRQKAQGGTRTAPIRRSRTSYAFFQIAQSGKRKWAGPKRQVPDIRAKIEKAAVEDAWPEVLRIQNMLEAASGCRGGREASGRTMHDWLVLGDANSIGCINKGSGDERRKLLAFNDPRAAAMRDWVNGGRLERDPGRDMAYFEALACKVKEGGDGAEAAEEELRDAHIFLGPRGRPYSYRTKARYLRSSMVARGIAATGHAQRHEHSADAIAEIDAMPIDEGMKLALMREHGRQKCWADVDQMLEIYAGARMAARRVRLEVEFQDRRDKGQLAIQRRRADQIDIPEADIVAGIGLPQQYAKMFEEMPA